MKNLVIAGSGGHGGEVAWVAEDMNSKENCSSPWNILGYIDDDPSKTNLEFYGHKVLGLPENVAKDLGSGEIWYLCAIGNNEARERMTDRLNAIGWRAATVIHPTVVRAKNICIGEGTYIAPMCILSPNCKIGRHAIVNQRASIGHDAIIQDFSQICPGAQVNGFCQVGRSSLVGSNASIYQGRSVGDNATVGANSLVINNVATNTSVIGIPARTLPIAKS